MRLIPDWKKAWKLPSVQGSLLGVLVMGVIEVIQQAWTSLPPHILERIPHSNRIGLILFLLVLLFRVMTFEKKDDGK